MDISRSKKQAVERKPVVDIFGNNIEHGPRQSGNIRREGEPVHEKIDLPEYKTEHTALEEHDAPNRAIKKQPLGNEQIVPPPQAKSQMEMRLESILEDGLEQIYQDMPPSQQEAFRMKGEETARAIESLLMHAKAAAHTILSLIRGWLKMIPGVSALFLEQEAKIKTDKIMGIARNNVSRYR